MSTKRKFWVTGVIVAAIGVVIARVLSPTIGEVGLQFGIFVLGVIVAVAGLGIIMYGLRK